MNDLNRVPHVDDLERKYGFVRTDDNPRTYVLLGLPTPIRGPAFAAIGTDCVGAYAVEVLDTENVPTGTVGLAVWPDAGEFERNANPAAILNMAVLTGT